MNFSTNILLWILIIYFFCKLTNWAFETAFAVYKWKRFKRLFNEEFFYWKGRKDSDDKEAVIRFRTICDIENLIEKVEKNY